jgi:hypothetical protein
MPKDDAARLKDPPDGGTSLTNVGELLFGCLEAVGARSILEIGAYEGDLTVELLKWANDHGAELATVDPDPPKKLRERTRQHSQLVLHEKTSHEVIAGLDSPPDAIVIDGDHNYYTLTEELRLIAELAAGDRLPLLMFHDVRWPHERRDTFYDPSRVPEDQRPPIGKDVGLVPGNPGVDPLGLEYPWAALQEGGPRNGTLTAIEDFVESRDDLHLAIVPLFFGFGVVWPDGIEGGERIAELLEPYDRHPMLERIERNRIDHMSASHARSQKIAALEERVRQQEHVLRQMLDSRAFTVGEYVSRAYKRGKPAFSREAVKRALGRR